MYQVFLEGREPIKSYMNVKYNKSILREIYHHRVGIGKGIRDEI